MPKLIKVTTERVYLPSTEDEPNEEDRAWVEFKNKVTGGDWMAAGFGSDDVERTALLLTSLITNWNFTDEEGNIEPINAESVGRLDGVDFSFLSVKLGNIVQASAASKLPDGEKKTTSTSTLTPTIPGINPA